MAPVGSIRIPLTVARAAVVGDSIQLVGEALTAVGLKLQDVTIKWTSTNQAMATVTPSGLVRFHAPGVVNLTATARGASFLLPVAGLPEPVEDWSDVHVWSTMAGDSARSGLQPVTVDLRAIALRWSTQMGFYTGPSVTDGEKIYLNVAELISGQERGSLRAFDATIGTPLWVRLFGPDSHTFSPALADGRLYAQGNESLRRIHIMEASSGADLVPPVPVAFSAMPLYAPIVADGQLLTGGDGLQAIDRISGSLDWVAVTPGSQLYGHSVWKDEVVVMLPRELRVYDRATGEEVRRVPDDGGPEFDYPSLIAIDPAGIATVIRWFRLAAFDLVTGTRLWELAAGYRGSPTIANGRVLAWNGPTLEARNALTGAILWTFSMGSGFGIAIAATDNLIFATHPVGVFALDAATGLVVWWAPGGGSIAIGDGILVVSVTGGRLSAYSLR